MGTSWEAVRRPFDPAQQRFPPWMRASRELLVTSQDSMSPSGVPVMWGPFRIPVSTVLWKQLLSH